MNTPFQNIELQKYLSNKTRTMSYRFGFNGKENDNEVKGTGNQQDFQFRIYDSRLGRFLSVDPLHRSFSFSSPYAYALNRVIDGKDLEGLEYTPYWHMGYPEVTDVTSAMQFFNAFLYNSTVATVYNTSSAAINITTSAAVGIKNEGVATYTHKVATKAAEVVTQIATTPITLKDVKTSFTTVENYEAIPLVFVGAALGAGYSIPKWTNPLKKEVANIVKAGFSNFNNLDELAKLFKGRNLVNATDDLLNSGWTRVEGDWGSKTVFQKQIGKERYYAIWESSNLEHSTNKLPTAYWKLTRGKINATKENVRRLSDAPNFRK